MAEKGAKGSRICGMISTGGRGGRGGEEDAEERTSNLVHNPLLPRGM